MMNTMKFLMRIGVCGLLCMHVAPSGAQDLSPVAAKLVGRWDAYQAVGKVAECEVRIVDRAVTFTVFNRAYNPTTVGRFIDASAFITDERWRRERGVVRDAGDRIDWEDSTWVRAGAPAPKDVVPGSGGGYLWTSPHSQICGTWSLLANSYAGKLEISTAAGGLTGRMYYNAYGSWENLQNVTFDPASGVIRFLRPGPKQWYTGLFSNGQFQGTFDQGGSGKYEWKAWSGSVQPKPQTETEKPTTSTQGNSGETGIGGTITGTWKIVANRHSGELEISQESTGLTGRIRLGIYAWENLRFVKYDPSTATIRFLRPGSPSQHYIGVLRDGSIEGTFDQDTGKYNYKWKATK